MIIKFDQLPLFEKKVIMVDGCFDPLHLGHIEYFIFATSFNLPVFCNVENDHYIEKYKNRPSLLPEKQRVRIIDSIRFISYTHLQTTSTADVLAKLKPLKYIKGADWEQKKLPEEEIEVCKKYDIQIEYMTKNFDSSSRLLRRYLRKYGRFRK